LGQKAGFVTLVGAGGRIALIQGSVALEITFLGYSFILGWAVGLMTG
jgi:hypothetical protein